MGKTPETTGNAETRYAAIDIGSNAVRLLIKRIDPNEGDRLTKMLLIRIPLRLGLDAFSLGEISKEKVKKLVRLMKAYRQMMKIYDVEAYRACATSAMRDARNGAEIIRKVQRATGIPIEIIDGQEEARMIYNNHIEYMRDRCGNFMYIDVGGGSTEINLLVNGQLLCSRSYNIGTIRMLNRAVAEEEWMRLQHDMEEIARNYPHIDIIGSGGNINKLYRLSPHKDEDAQRIATDALAELHAAIERMSVKERIEQLGLKPDRADVIVPAGTIFLFIARCLQARYIYVPMIGLADGIIDEIYVSRRKAARQIPIE